MNYSAFSFSYAYDEKGPSGFYVSFGPGFGISAAMVDAVKTYTLNDVLNLFKNVCGIK